MSEKEDKESKEEFIKERGEILIGETRFFVPIYTIDGSKINVYEELKKIPELNSNFSDEELRLEVEDFIVDMSFSPPKNGNDLRNKIKKFIENLKREKEYEAIIILNGLSNLPIGLKIYCLEIIEEDKDKKELLDHIEGLEKRKKGKIIKNSSWGKVRFKTYRTQRIGEILFKKLESPYSILSFVMRIDLDVKNTIGVIYPSEKRLVIYLEPFKRWGASKYKKEIFGKYMDILSKMTQKNPNKLEKKILQAIRIFWLSRLSHKIEIRFLMLISAFESLLLTKNDRDYLGKKLSEKVAFLIESDYKKRINLYKHMKKYYGKRSELVHGGNVKISEEDEMTVENIFRRLLFKLLELSKEYNKMEQKSSKKGKEGVEDFINKLKFS